MTFRALVLVTVAAIASALAPSTVHAQVSPPPPAAPTQPAAAPQKFSGSATAGISLESGRTDLNGIQLVFDGRRPYATGSTMTMFASYAYATTITPGQSARVTVANRFTASFDVSRNFGERGVMMLRSQALRDPVARLNYRFGEMAGFGVRLGDKRVQVRVIPGMALFNDDKYTDLQTHVHYGLYQDLTTTLSPAWKLTQYVSGSRSVSTWRDYLLTFEASLTGAITKRVAIQMSYHYDYESFQPPGIDPEYQKTMAGVQIRF